MVKYKKGFLFPEITLWRELLQSEMFCPLSLCVVVAL